MGIKANTKKTEIGEFPGDWYIKSLEEIAEIDSYSLRSNTDPDYHFFYISLEDVNEGKLTSVSELTFREAPSRARRIIKQNDILFSTVRPNLLSHYFVKPEVKNFVCSTGFSVVTSNIRIVYPNFLFPLFFSEIIIKQISMVIAGSNYPAINSTDVKKIKIPLPPLAEQQAIAIALSDVDELISSLEALIDKKRAIKQGVMQELLTGKKRLPGFSDKWEKKKLGKLCGKITTGKLDANAMVPNGDYRFYTCASTYFYIDRFAFDAEALLISGNGANVGYVHYYKGKFNAYQRTYVLYDFTVDITFIKYVLDMNLQKRIQVEVNAGNTPYIKMDTLTEMEILLPTTIIEQQAIAEVLSNIDTEITTLEQKLEKTNLIKQGMMQELLTGRIRFIGG